MSKCVICSGSRTVKLPTYKPASAFVPRAAAISVEIDRDAFRTYPCPECTTVPDHQLHVVGGEYTATSAHDLKYPAYRDAMNKQAAHMMVDYLLEHKLIEFHDLPRGYHVTTVQAKIAVVTPNRIEPLEQRVKAATRPALEALAKRAADSVSIWGREIGRSTITKDEAVRFINEALREELSK